MSIGSYFILKIPVIAIKFNAKFGFSFVNKNKILNDSNFNNSRLSFKLCESLHIERNDISECLMSFWKYCAMKIFII